MSHKNPFFSHKRTTLSRAAKQVLYCKIYLTRLWIQTCIRLSCLWITVTNWLDTLRLKKEQNLFKKETIGCLFQIKNKKNNWLDTNVFKKGTKGLIKNI